MTAETVDACSRIEERLVAGPTMAEEVMNTSGIQESKVKLQDFEFEQALVAGTSMTVPEVYTDKERAFLLAGENHGTVNGFENDQHCDVYDL